MIKFQEKLQVFPVLAPADITTSATGTQYVDLKGAHWCTFIVNFGAITGDTTAVNDTVGVTVEASTAGSSNATEAGIPFSYRLSSAVGTYSHGAITAATSDGAQVGPANDNKTLFVDVDPAALPSNPGADYRFVRLVLTPGSATTSLIVDCQVALEPRYPGNAIPSAT